jgi:hypothetical protein
MSSLIAVDGSEAVRQWHQKALLHRFGPNPYGENLYRVVWSDSRKHMVGGTWNDYSGKPLDDRELAARGGRDPNLLRSVSEYRWIPLYPRFHGWVIEKWLSALEFCGTPMSFEILQADTAGGLLPLPYPHRGEYVESQKLLMGMEPNITLVAEIVHLIEKGRGLTINQKARGIKDNLEKSEAAHLSKVDDMWKEAQGAFNNRASNVHPGKRTAKDINFRYAASDLKHLPQEPGKFVTLKGKP